MTIEERMEIIKQDHFKAQQEIERLRILSLKLEGAFEVLSKMAQERKQEPVEGE
ncbi:MAG: hypothetical protein GX947_02455 [Tissierellia bacterium]|nr:hypothetical protein [Tissierellia bacterium]